jgi:hypothetical protein
VPTPFSAKRLNHKRGQLEAACTRFFGRPLRIEIESTHGDAASAEAAGQGAEAARQRRQQALEHPAVRRALEILDGEIVEIHPSGGDA